MTKEKNEADTNLSKELQGIVDSVSNLNVLQISQLVKAMEDKFGVTASAPVVMATAVTGANGQEATAAEEKASYKVVLKSDGGKKIPVIKALREIKTNLGLKEAKELVDEAPSVVEEDADKELAEKIKKKLEEAGAEISLE
ncbi:50S ribosomal protein L7/L12 [Patescibacteria group bacterium]|nr:50S ribosomal protein L7/L12 [Patescibacteria group bacterium]